MYALHSLYSPPGRFATLRLDRQIRLDLNTYNTYFSALCIIPSISYTCFATSTHLFRLRLSFPAFARFAPLTMSTFGKADRFCTPKTKLYLPISFKQTQTLTLRKVLKDII